MQTVFKPLSVCTVRRTPSKPGSKGPNATEGGSREGLKSNPVGEALEKYAVPDTGVEMALFPFVRRVEKSVQQDPLMPELQTARSKELEALAAADLTNIDIPERTRRNIFGGALLSVALALDAWLLWNGAGFWSRFAVTPLLGLGMGYVASGQLGICNVAQSGMWQIEGEGLKKIEDPDLAQRILNKVNKFNLTLSLASLALSFAISSIPVQ